MDDYVDTISAEQELLERLKQKQVCLEKVELLLYKMYNLSLESASDAPSRKREDLQIQIDLLSQEIEMLLQQIP